jgi:hypothetical protein
VFIELMPLLGERTVMITVSRVNQHSIRVNFIPSRKKEDENPAPSPCNAAELFRDPRGTGPRARNQSCFLCGRKSPPANYTRGSQGRNGGGCKSGT